MTLIAMTIPDEPAAQAAWLEKHLVGLDLHALVAELTAVHGNESPGGSLREVLGPRLGTVLENGLRGLPRDTLRALLRRPALLLELQDAVLTEGGPYWDAVPPATPEVDALVSRGAMRLSQLSGPIATPAKPIQRAWYLEPWFVSASTAAAVLIAVFLVGRTTKPDDAGGQVAQNRPAWGWAKPDALPAEAPPTEYLKTLASAADEWFKKTPADAPALAQRLGEFRQGCSTLLLAEHKPLAPADRAWLKERCQAWAVKINKQLADLESGKPVPEVQQAADDMVRQIATALRTRAETVRS
jgi:hypothetical protein